MSLRFRINLLITVLTSVFTLAVLQLALDDTRRSIREEMEGANRITLQLLAAVINDSRLIARDGEDGNVVLRSLLREIGRVRAHDIRLFDHDDKLIYASPPSLYRAGVSAPPWFSKLVAPELPVMNLAVEGGNVTVTTDPSRSVLDAWEDAKRVLVVIVAFLAVVNVLVFFLTGRSLRPVSTVLEGLKRMERGEYHARLPGFALPEFDAISHTFNGMADALEQSHAENRRLALIAEQSGDAIVIVDPDGLITYWNPAAERLFGWNVSQIVGHPASLTVPPERAAEQEGWSRLVRERGSIDHVETQRLTRDRRLVEVALSASPLIDPVTDRVIGEILSMRDITETKRAREAELQLAQNRKLTQLTQVRLEEERRAIARELHDELGQCVTAIKTIGAVIVQKTAASGGDIHRSAETIVSVASHMYDSVHGIIRQLRPSALDHLGLREALEDAIGSWGQRHPEIACRVHLEGHLDELGERVNITVFRIVQECLNNVVKHARATQIEISVIRQETGCLDVLVRDNGRGLTERDGTDSMRFGIMGMRERVEALKGEFALDTVPGGGLAVKVRIPLGEQAGEEGATASLDQDQGV